MKRRYVLTAVTDTTVALTGHVENERDGRTAGTGVVASTEDK